MIKTNTPRRNRNPQPKSNSGKVPLTYYRSASGKTGAGSPFIRNNPPPRIKKYIFGALDMAVLFLLLLLFLYSLIINPLPSITASSYTYNTAQVYQQVAEKELKPFTNRNKLTINEAQIIKNLRAGFPEIESGSIELPIISQTPKIHLKISEPAFLLRSNGVSYVVNSNGIVVGRPSAFPNLAPLPEVVDETNFKVQPGQPALSSSSAKFIQSVIGYTKASNLEIAAMVLPPLPMEFSIKAADKPYEVKFYMGGDAALQAGQFLAARAQFEKDGINPQEYLDVRVQGKIFYK